MKTGSEGKDKNIVYVFVPFRFGNADVVVNAAKAICAKDDPIWEDAAEGIRSYFLKYLTDKVVPPGKDMPDLRCCIHVGAKERSLGWRGDRDKVEWEKALVAQKEKFGFSMDDVFHLYPKDYHRNTYGESIFDFRIDSLKLTVFGTGVGIVSFGLVLGVEDALNVAFAEYLFKMAAEEQDRSTNFGRRNSILQRKGDGARTDFTALARKVVVAALGSIEANFGFYSRKPRVNLFTLFIPSEEKADGSGFEREHYYLSNGYGPGYAYPGDGKDVEAQYLGDPNIRWGVSNEVVCCLARPELHKPSSNFIYDSFYHKFRREYLFMYIWQLHQKYAIYAFLADISTGGLNVPDRDKAEALREYKRRFVDFEANYVFARITEVPQYQRLYDAVARQFALRTMYKDVKEPIGALEELFHDDEARAQEREQRATTRITTILAGMALLSVFSAYIDSYDFIGKWFGPDSSHLGYGVRVGQGICVIGITVVVLFVLGYLLRCMVNATARSGSRSRADGSREIAKGGGS